MTSLSDATCLDFRPEQKDSEVQGQCIIRSPTAAYFQPWIGGT
jgi:hypothetical protein